MNDYFPIMLVFGFVITFLFFIIFLFSPKNHYIELEDYTEKINISEQIDTFVDLIDRLKKENLELSRTLNRTYNKILEVEKNDRC